MSKIFNIPLRKGTYLEKCSIGRSFSWSGYWATQDLFDFLWMGDISGNELVDVSGNGNNVTINDKDFAGNYIPATSSATFSCPDNATFIANDSEDGLWFEYNEPGNVDVDELIGYDFSRTIVKYDNSSPYHVRWIGILKSGVTLTTSQINKLHQSFDLSVYWSGVFNEYGVLKGNRSLERSVYTSSVQPPSNVAVSLEGSDVIRVTWTDNTSDEDGFRIYVSVEGADYVELDTVAADVTQYDDTRPTPVTTISYKVVAYKGTGETAYSNVATTATLGDILNGASPCENAGAAPYTSFSAVGNYGFDAVSDGSGLHICGTADELSIVNTEEYRVVFDITLNSGIVPEYMRLVTQLGSTSQSNTVNPIEGGNTHYLIATGTTTGALQLWHGFDAGDYEVRNLEIRKVLNR